MRCGTVFAYQCAVDPRRHDMMAAQAALVGTAAHPTRRLALRPTDLIVLVVVVGFVVPVASDLLGIRDPRAIVVLAVCWASAALRRLIAWRTGQWRPRRFLQDGGGRAAAGAIIVLGFAPWFVLPLLQGYSPHSPLWGPISLPPWLRAGGAVLLLGGVIRPFLAAWRSDRPGTAAATRGPAAVESVTPGMLVDGLGFGLLAASPLLGVLVILWLALTRSVSEKSAHAPLGARSALQTGS
jgi:hypothetical protein